MKGQNNFLVTECFLTCSWRFLIPNRLEQLEFKLEFRNMLEKLEKKIGCSRRFYLIFNKFPKYCNIFIINIFINEISYRYSCYFRNYDIFCRVIYLGVLSTRRSWLHLLSMSVRRIWTTDSVSIFFITILKKKYSIDDFVAF